VRQNWLSFLQGSPTPKLFLYVCCRRAQETGVFPDMTSGFVELLRTTVQRNREETDTEFVSRATASLGLSLRKIKRHFKSWISRSCIVDSLANPDSGNEYCVELTNLFWWQLKLNFPGILEMSLDGKDLVRVLRKVVSSTVSNVFLVFMDTLSKMFHIDRPVYFEHPSQRLTRDKWEPELRILPFTYINLPTC
jgi:hypothetical protein